jgi:hypothetical protein
VEELATEIQLAWRVHCANKELQKETAEVKAEKQRIEEELFGILD